MKMHESMKPIGRGDTQKFKGKVLNLINTESHQPTKIRNRE